MDAMVMMGEEQVTRLACIAVTCGPGYRPLFPPALVVSSVPLGSAKNGQRCIIIRWCCTQKLTRRIIVYKPGKVLLAFVRSHPEC